MEAVVGIDIGTESVRAAAFDLHGNLLSSASYSVELNFPFTGWVEVPANAYFQSLRNSVRRVSEECRNQRVRVIAISVGATGSSLLCSDHNGEPLSPVVLWMDNRSVSEAEIITSKLREFSSSEWLPAKSAWVSKNWPELWGKSRYVSEFLDWINFKLTGKWVSSQCNTVCKRNSNNPNSPSVFSSYNGVNLFDKWPEQVCKVAEPIGYLSETLAKEFSLSESTLVVQGGIDAYLGMIGSSCLTEGSLSMTLGTSTVILGHALKPISNNTTNGVWGPFNSPILPDYWVVEGGQISSGSVLNWVCSISGKSHEELIHEIKKSGMYHNSSVLMIENLQGNRTPYLNEHATGAIFGLRLSHTSVDLYNAALKATALGAREAIDRVAESIGTKINRIRVSGGGARNALWLQAHVDALDQTLQVPKFPDKIGLLGAAMVAATGARIYRNLVDATLQMQAEYTDVDPGKVHSSSNDSFLEVRKLAYSSTECVGSIHRKLLEEV